MGKKINPNVYRMEFNMQNSTGAHCLANWIAPNKKSLLDNIKEDSVIRSTISNAIHAQNYTEVVINRSGTKVSVDIYTHKPGTVIGKQGAEITKLKNQITKLTKKDINLEIKEVRRPELEPKLIAEEIAQELSIKGNYKRVAKRCVAFAMKSGCKGILIKISGRIGGVSIARIEKYTNGSLKRQTISEDVRSYSTKSLASYGTCGICVTVRIGNRERRTVA